jgi:hypothetical protein
MDNLYGIWACSVVLGLGRVRVEVSATLALIFSNEPKYLMIYSLK